ncbi:hypothetical protein [Sorangium sp. So ce887]|uniref:hypothetical protein n=1 Tax=Sorangium sp. So ce887 TaxID=3133324 RepID=UPI003F61C356
MSKADATAERIVHDSSIDAAEMLRASGTKAEAATALSGASTGHLYSIGSSMPHTGESHPVSMQYEVSARLAGRAVARKIPKERYAELMSEHQRLAMKEVLGNISTSESRQLRLVRWQIDRVEDARHGQDIDRLEEIARVHQTLAHDINALVSQLGPVSGKGKGRSKSRG